MAFDVLHHCTFLGPALPEPFVQFELERELLRLGLLVKTTGAEGDALQESWASYRRRLRELAASGGSVRVRNQVVEPLVSRLGYERLEEAPKVETREGPEAGGHLLVTADGQAKLRAWCTAFEEDLDAPARRGSAYRYSHARSAERVLLASGERLGLLTNGVELRLLLCDPARPGSQVAIPIHPHWKRSRDLPDSYRLLLALASPAGVRAVPELVEKARLQQTRVTKDLRVQARQAIERFVQEVLDHPENRGVLDAHADKARLARDLWHEALVLVYRLLFLLKLEATDDPARAFGFASSSLWRNTFSPSVALAPHARRVLDEGAETGSLLEDGLRALFRMFVQGVSCTELNVKPLGGALFGAEKMPLLTGLRWGERAVAHLLDRLLWTPRRRGSEARQRVHYGPLDVKDLGRVYEALLELEPGIAAEPMCRLRRQKLEVVVPVVQGEKYRPAQAPAETDETIEAGETAEPAEEPEEPAEVDEPEEEAAAGRGKKTKVEWIEKIAPGRFYLRVGLGRKSTGSFYTPDSFVRFLVQETLGPLCAERSPKEDPKPGEILKLKVLDPAMGSGHFQVEACRFLGEKLYEACRLCDEKALEAERKAEKAKTDAERQAALGEAAEYRRRVADLPDPDDELVRYLPSRAPEGEESGFSQKRAEALCRRLVAVHCLYGVDKNPLAVELAKLALWIETQAEGLPLTFLDHRFLVGDSLTGPFFEHLLKYPGSQKPIHGLFTQGLRERFTAALQEALTHVRELEATVGASLGEIEAKQAAKARLDRALAPFKVVAAAWAGGVMLGEEGCDDPGYERLLKAVAETADLPEDLSEELGLRRMIARGLGLDEVPADRQTLLGAVADGVGIPALPFELAFPEVFFPTGTVSERGGFHVTHGNPPWDAIQFKTKEFFAAFDFEILDAPTKRERSAIEQRLQADPAVAALFVHYKESFEELKRANDVLYRYQKVQVEGDLAGRQIDAFRVFMERNAQLLCSAGMTGVLVPSAFHANAGATGVRQLYLEEMALRFCYSFENARQLFEIHRSFKFATVVAHRTGPTASFPCAFYLHDDEWLFGDRRSVELDYSMDFVRRTGGAYLNFLELANREDAVVARSLWGGAKLVADEYERSGLRFRMTELHLSHDSDAFINATDIVASDPRTGDGRKEVLLSGHLLVYEGKFFDQYDATWGTSLRYIVAVSRMLTRPSYLQAAQYFRVVFREVARSNDERTLISALLPPGCLTGHTAPVDEKPWERTNAFALCSVATLNSYAFDWLVRIRSSAHVTKFLLIATPVPTLSAWAVSFLAHGALRLSCNDSAYAPLWSDQLGEAWREANPRMRWPVLKDDDSHWEVRAAIDAVIADAYGLSREQYAHVLATFSHASYPKARELCLAKFDELKAIGLEAFTKKYDPYWDIPLNENLPRPVIDLPGVEEQGTRTQESGVGKARGRKVAPPGSLNAESGLPNPVRTQLSFLPLDSGPLFRQPASTAKLSAPEPPLAPRKPSPPTASTRTPTNSSNCSSKNEESLRREMPKPSPASTPRG